MSHSRVKLDLSIWVILLSFKLKSLCSLNYIFSTACPRVDLTCLVVHKVQWMQLICERINRFQFLLHCIVYTGTTGIHNSFLSSCWNGVRKSNQHFCLAFSPYYTFKLSVVRQCCYTLGFIQRLAAYIFHLLLCAHSSFDYFEDLVLCCVSQLTYKQLITFDLWSLLRNLFC